MNRGTFVRWIALIATIGLFINCASKNNNSDTTVVSSALTIAGSLGSPQAKPTRNKLGALAVTYTDYSVRCTTLTGTPQAGTGTVNADGSFSLSITLSDSSPVAIGCFIITTGSGKIAATFAFDSGSQGIGAEGVGETAMSGSVSGGAGEEINFGAIEFDPDTGTAVVAESNIVRTGDDNSIVVGSWTDATGVWNVSCMISEEYECPEEGNNFSIYLRQLYAKDATNEVHTGLSVWESASAFSACGSTEDLDAILPTGWTSSNASGTTDTSMNTNFTLGNLPTATEVYATSWNNDGKTTCGFPVTIGTTKCSDISTNTDNWGSGAGTYTASDCQAMCVANNVWNNQSTCRSRFEVDWSYTQNKAPGVVATEFASFNNGTNQTTNSYIKRESEPESRYVLGELKVNGNMGTVLSTKSRTSHFCKPNVSGGGCTDKACIITENVRMSIVQSSATTATIEVVIAAALDSGSPNYSDCATDSVGNYVYDEINETKKFLLNASKQ